MFLVPEVLIFFVGPIIDRLNPKKILIFSLAIQLILIGALVTFGNSLKANSILSITYKIFDAIFNGVSGFLLAAFSTIALFKINLIIFAIPIFVVLFIRFIYKKNHASYNFSEYFSDLKDGIIFIKNSSMLYILSPLIFVNFFNSSNAVILPFFCQQYNNPSETFGFILAIFGVGEMLGAILINYFKKFLPVGKLLSLLLITNGILWLCFIFTGGSILSYIFVLLAHIFYCMYNIIYYSLFQGITPIKLLGRVITGIDTIIIIAMPLGSLFGGWILKFMPYSYSMIFSGISVIVAGIFYYKLTYINSLPYIDNVERIEL